MKETGNLTVNDLTIQQSEGIEYLRQNLDQQREPELKNFI